MLGDPFLAGWRGFQPRLWGRALRLQEVWVAVRGCVRVCRDDDGGHGALWRVSSRGQWSWFRVRQRSSSRVEMFSHGV